ncbi:hypothetical protein H0X48_04820 [Candidatus Dependentiae bacterium]|nr:hypothetical protein [Candidatus Dependentiae bacterium]
MKTKNVTFSIPINLINTLHSRVNKRELSRFVVKALQKALEEEAITLKAAYSDANNDADRLEALEDWQNLDSESWQ